MATLNYHLAFSDQTIKFQDWERFISECSDPSSNAGVGGSYDDMFGENSVAQTSYEIMGLLKYGSLWIPTSIKNYFQHQTFTQLWCLHLSGLSLDYM